MSFQLGVDRLDCQMLVQLASEANPNVTVNSDVREKLQEYRNIVESAIKTEKKIYGINTGFGYLSDVYIKKEQLEELQVNLIRSHACGVGNSVNPEIVRALLILRAHTFCLLHSAVSLQCIDTILAFLKHDILPLVPVKGSVGASGDLAPLSHLALGLLGEGEVFFQGAVVPASEALEACGIDPYVPKAKEGLSLINGTQFMTAIAAFAISEAKELAVIADVATSLSLDALRGTKRAYDPRIHQVRPQIGQRTSADNINSLFANEDEIMNSHVECGKVQDPYSFRCAAQVHGASRDTISFVEKTVEIELNSVTDNPLVFADGDVISGGNFHGQPIAMAMDFLAIAVAELGSISERRIEKLTNPSLSSLPAFITKDSGLNSGFMIPHVVAASLVSENKVLCHPACVDSIPTSADKEDHVSMGPIAARKARDVIDNVYSILAIELLSACQGLDLLAPLRPSEQLAVIYDKIREISPFMDKDRSLAGEFRQVVNWIKNGEIRSLLSKNGYKFI
ncbi:MAG: histidine ammonia-lyase [Bdellovibrionota bacterium]